MFLGVIFVVISMCFNYFCETLILFCSNVSLLIPLICLEDIRIFEDSRGSIELMKIDIIDVLDLHCLFAKLSVL